MNKLVLTGGVALGLYGLWSLMQPEDAEASTAPEDPALLAQRVAETLRRGPQWYDRDVVRAFQRAVGIPDSGLYDAHTRSALGVYGIADPPPPFAGPHEEVDYFTSGLPPVSGGAGPGVMVPDPSWFSGGGGVPGLPIAPLTMPGVPSTGGPAGPVFTRETLARASTIDLETHLALGTISMEQYLTALDDSGRLPPPSPGLDPSGLRPMPPMPPAPPPPPPPASAPPPTMPGFMHPPIYTPPSAAFLPPIPSAPPPDPARATPAPLDTAMAYDAWVAPSGGIPNRSGYGVAPSSVAPQSPFPPPPPSASDPLTGLSNLLPPELDPYGAPYVVEPEKRPLASEPIMRSATSRLDAEVVLPPGTKPYR